MNQQRYLLIIEGESNAESARLSSGSWLDALAYSESVSSDDLAGYKWVGVWADDAGMAIALQGRLGAHVAILSPILEGRTYNASDILRMGQLDEVLRYWFEYEPELNAAAVSEIEEILHRAWEQTE